MQKILPLFAMLLFSAGNPNGSAHGASPARKIPEFEFKTLDGKLIRSRDLLGKVTIIDFWAVWCKPCIAEVPEYNAFYKEYKSKGVVLLGLAADSGTEEEVKNAVSRFKISYPVISLSLKELDVFGDIPVFPTTWVIDSKGMITKEILGSTADKHKILRSLADSLLVKR